MRRPFHPAACLTLLLAAAVVPLLGQRPAAPRRNIVIFIADGLRHDSVNAQDTPALWRIRTEGVHFESSHSMFPTFTMANASAIATGHGLGDTGIYGNTILSGFAMFDTANFNQLPGTPLPFIENDEVLSDLDDHFGGNLMPYVTLLAAARAHGYRTATIGKLGPAAMLDLSAIAPVSKAFPLALPGPVIDDATGGGAGLALPQALSQMMSRQGVPIAAPTRSNGYDASSPFNNGLAGSYSTPGTLAANVIQQDWFAEVTTRFVLPFLSSDPASPFALAFWSRDPDGTQHNTGDSMQSLSPGINGPTSRAAVRNADRTLQRLMAWFDANPAIRDNTDIVVTSDHGVATISRNTIDRMGRTTAAESAKHDYVGTTGSVDTLKGTLPVGYLALDLAYDLQLDVFDPDTRVGDDRAFKRLRIGSSSNPTPVDKWEHPARGNALLASDIRQPNGSDARIIVAANGGSDLIYIPDRSPETLRRVVARLLTYDYVGGLFVDDGYGNIPGTLPLSAVGLIGASKLPRPAVVVAFKVFDLNPDNLLTAVQLSDTTYQDGQGMHGGFGRDSTFNNMAAIGPDFKRGLVDRAPVGNSDIAPTLAHLMGFELEPGGALRGRVLSEAVVGGRAADSPIVQYRRSTPADGKQTVVVFREFDGRQYFERGCFASVGTPDKDLCR